MGIGSDAIADLLAQGARDCLSQHGSNVIGMRRLGLEDVLPDRGGIRPQRVEDYRLAESVREDRVVDGGNVRGSGRRAVPPLHVDGIPFDGHDSRRSRTPHGVDLVLDLVADHPDEQSGKLAGIATPQDLHGRAADFREGTE